MLDTYTTRITVDAKINGLFESQKENKIYRMYQPGLKSHWNPDDINWLDDIGFGTELPNSSEFVINEFKKSAIGYGGRSLWDKFRWELQSWLVSQFYHGEQAALVTSSQLVMILSDQNEKYVAANQVSDEAKHANVFARYINNYISEPYPLSGDLKNMVTDTINASDLDITIIGMQVMIECLADATFRLAASTFHDPVIKNIVDKVANDEARHIAFGVVLLKKILPNLSKAEISIREDFILSSADAIRNRFYLDDIWERINVSKSTGRHFAINSSLMISFRRIAFSKIVSVLSKTGLMTDRVYKHLYDMSLLRV